MEETLFFLLNDRGCKDEGIRKVRSDLSYRIVGMRVDRRNEWALVNALVLTILSSRDSQDIVNEGEGHKVIKVVRGEDC